MALQKEQVQAIEQAAEKFLSARRPPPEIRDQLDLGYRIEGQSVYLFEIRPRLDDPDQKMESPVAKGTFIKRRKLWKIYWMRADLKWHPYQPTPSVGSIADFFEVVDRDDHGAFFG